MLFCMINECVRSRGFFLNGRYLDFKLCDLGFKTLPLCGVIGVQILEILVADLAVHVVLIELFDDPQKQLESDGTLFILKTVEDDGGEEILVTIDDDDELARVSKVFEETFEDLILD